MGDDSRQLRLEFGIWQRDVLDGRLRCVVLEFVPRQWLRHENPIIGNGRPCDHFET
jgi:hypothetical protein